MQKVKDKQSHDNRTELFGWFINESCYPLLAQLIDFKALQALRKHYSLYSPETRSKTIDLHLIEGIPEEVQKELLRVIIPTLKSSEEPERKKIQLLIKNLIQIALGEREFTTWDSLKTILNLPLEKNDKLDIVLARGLGIQSVNNCKIIQKLTNDLLNGDSQNIRLNRDAVDEIICGGAGDVVVSSLLNIVPSYIEIPNQRRNSIITLFQDRIPKEEKNRGKDSKVTSNIIKISCLLSLESRRHLAKWFTSIKDEDPSKLLSILIGLSDELPDVQESVKQLINELGQLANKVISKLPIIPEYLVNYLQTTDSDKESRKVLVKIQSIKARNKEPEAAIAELLEKARDSSDKVAIAATKELIKLIGQQKRPNINDWILILEESNCSSVRGYCFDALNQLVEQDMTDKHLTCVWENLLVKPRKSVLSEMQKMGDLVASWIKLNKCVPSNVIEIIDGIVQYLKTNPNGDIAGSLFRIFKAITRSKDRVTLCSMIIAWTRTVLINIDVKTITNGQSEVSQTLRLVNDLDLSFLRILVEEDCPKMQPKERPQNVCAVAEAIIKKGTQLILLDDIRRSSWCPPEAIALISKFQLKS